MQHSRERILTTHTGSLPRPAALVQMYARRANGEHVDEALINDAGHRAMQESVERQLSNGIDVGNNGEQQREGFFLYVQRRMSGFSGSWKRWARGDVERYPEFKQMMSAQATDKVAVSNFLPPRVTGDIQYIDPALAASEAIDFKAELAGRSSKFSEAFLTAPSPGIIAAACKNEHYATEESYLAALGEALRLEYEAIVNNGFILQIDCPDLALERHVSYHDESDAKFLGFVERVVTAINSALRNIPRDRVRMHVCWGNYEGPHDCDVPLHKIWLVVSQAKVGGFVLPFANARHAHEMTVLRERPLADDQVIVAGVIDVLTNFVEHPEVVADRLVRCAAEVGDPTRVLAGTDCGFDTSAGMGRVATDVVWAKLRTLAEGARLASDRLIK
ncbi:MAG: cobalamin-independent methionine synthase II family protein [Alcaligenaceae bacterium]